VISIPNGWKPRDYQQAAWDAAKNGCLRHSLAWHRRAGKDDFALNRTAVGIMQRVGTYWHMLPQANQARRAIWDAVDERTGVRRIDQAFPVELREVTREHEMFIRFKNGSTWQVVGSDNYNALVGSPPIGVVYSEYAMADPASWAFLRPILANNGGWAMFISTPRGQNHFAKLHRFALNDPAWFAETLGVEDTMAIPAEVIDRERRELAAERGEAEARAIVEQEYYCSFDAALPGSYYGELITRMEAEGRIAAYPWDPRYPVGWGSDLGMRDSTTFWFWQDIGNRPRLINFFEGSGIDDVGWYVNKLNSLPYTYGRGLLPHDGGHNRLGMAGSIAEQMRRLGMKNEIIPVTKDRVAAINQTRLFLANAVINTEPEPFPGETPDEAAARMTRAITGLRMYRREWNEQAQRFNDAPFHDWCFAADTEVLTRCGTRQIIDLPDTGEVMTLCGWKPYHSPRLTRSNARVVEVTLSDGTSVRCTPDHKWLTESGWRFAESLLPGSRIQSCWTDSRSIGMGGFTGSGPAPTTIHAAESFFTGLFGRRRSERFLQDIKSIIETTIQPTTALKTLSACTLPSITKSDTQNQEIGSLATKLAPLRLNGIEARKEDCGTAAIRSGRRAGLSGSGSLGRAWDAAKRLIAWFAGKATNKSIAHSHARPVHIVSVKTVEATEPVWCITVPGEEHFALASGAIVHNCSNVADGLRSVAIGHRPLKDPSRFAAKRGGVRIADGV
jgi:hypothetical protein